jgi:non-specific serine/threonine protein kinase
LTVQRAFDNKTGVTYALLNLAKVARAAGDLDTAGHLYAESLPVWVEQNDILGTASCLRGLASVALARGDDERAARLYGAAERLNDDSGAYLPEPARARYLGVIDGLRVRMGDAVFAECWAEGRAMSRAETVELALAAETTSSDPLPLELTAPAEALSGLSPREHDVLRLLAAGQSNRDIASELFISHRTVETHVARILAKLGVASRAAAAIWAIQQGFN